MLKDLKENVKENLTAAVIEMDMDNQTFIRKYPREDFVTGSTLIVQQSQEALFFLKGEALDLFGPGKHILHTNNIPGILKALNKVGIIRTPNQTPFHSELYFINKTEQTAIKWGVGRITFLDHKNDNYPFQIGLNGTMNVRIDDSKKIITKLVGTEAVFDRDSFKNSFKSSIQMHLMSSVPELLQKQSASILELEKYQLDLSENLQKILAEKLSEYGIALEKFTINEFLKPENDPAYKDVIQRHALDIKANVVLKQGQIDGLSEVQKAQYQSTVSRIKTDDEKYSQDRLGYTYEDKKRFEVAGKIADNMPSNSASSELRTLGPDIAFGTVMTGIVGGAISGIVSQANGFNSANPFKSSGNSSSVPPANELKNKESEQTPEGNNQQTPSNKSGSSGDNLSDFKNNMEKLKNMKDNGLPEDRYQKKIDEILETIRSSGNIRKLDIMKDTGHLSDARYNEEVDEILKTI